MCRYIPSTRNGTCCLHVSTSYFISQLIHIPLRLAYRPNRFRIWSPTDPLIYLPTRIYPQFITNQFLPDNVENCGPTIPPRLSPYLLHLSSHSSLFQRRQRLVRLCGYRRPSHPFCLTRLLWLQSFKPDYYW